MSKIKIIAFIAIIFAALCSVIAFLGYKVNNLQEELTVYDNNFKSLNLENSKLQEGIIAYKLDIEQLEYINDSIIGDLNKTRKELKIKNKELLQMQKIKTETTIKDSIFIKDTIFRDSFVKLDTLVKDQWHSLAIQLEPTKLSIQAKYVSDLNVFATSSKEILGTPKKCFVGRLFQKKYKVIRVDVIDKNPYSVIKENKFVIIE